MTPEHFLYYGIYPALELLPKRMSSVSAEAMILAIALQESRLRERRQRGNGPARSYTQFETAGISGVLFHSASRPHALTLCNALDIAPVIPEVYRAIEHSDILCAGFSRLLLWTLPGRLPVAGAREDGWRQYLAAWRPGKPHPESWARAWETAWQTVGAIPPEFRARLTQTGRAGLSLPSAPPGAPADS